ncbi:Rhodanese-like protein [Trichocladium antarcticum]|uniref:Rhodanese-like protein n=1 Tax=Trichocladium antarcticum TaxID=1450529 RepID=A0AAN6UDU8_9PEZI|nr:Rhodanese-like protein [Trichocladium antarcticum]
MASRRAVVSLVQAAVPSSRAALPARAIRVASQLPLRQYHNRAQQHPQALRQPSTSCARYCATRTALAAKTRAYSTESEAKDTPFRVWDFEGIKKLTAKPNPAVTIIDVREPGELLETGRIPNAINIPITTSPDSFHISADEFEDRFGFPRPARDAEVIFYCRAGVRSRNAAGLAREAGWTNIGDYSGSWLDWEGKGGKVQK